MRFGVVAGGAYGPRSGGRLPALDFSTSLQDYPRLHEPGSRWTKPVPTKRRWYHQVVLGMAMVVGGFWALMIGSIIFVGRIAGW